MFQRYQIDTFTFNEPCGHGISGTLSCQSGAICNQARWERQMYCGYRRLQAVVVCFEDIWIFESTCKMFWVYYKTWWSVHCHQRGDGRWTIITARFRMCQVVWCKSVVCSDVWCGLPSCHATMDRIPWIDSSLNAGHGFSDSFKFPRRFWKSLVCLWFAWCAQNG